MRIDFIDQLTKNLMEIENSNTSISESDSSRHESTDDSPRPSELERMYVELKAKHKNLEERFDRSEKENKILKEELGI